MSYRGYRCIWRRSEKSSVWRRAGERESSFWQDWGCGEQHAEMLRVSVSFPWGSRWRKGRGTAGPGQNVQQGRDKGMRPAPWPKEDSGSESLRQREEGSGFPAQAETCPGARIDDKPSGPQVLLCHERNEISASGCVQCREESSVGLQSDQDLGSTRPPTYSSSKGLDWATVFWRTRSLEGGRQSEWQL